MHTTIVLAVAALAVSGCTPTTSEVGSVPPVRHVVVGGLPDQPLHEAERSTIDLDSGEPDATDPVAVAIDQLVQGLRAQGLEILDLGSETVALVDGHATVRVVVTHGTAPATTSYTSVYELDLIRGGDGAWSVTAARTVG
ncbi:MAG: hypothetical protein WD010_07505 [Nitriliruptor sp.]